MSAIGPQFYEFMKKLDENGGKLPTSITSRAFQPEFEFNNSTCYLCNGYYGPSFGEPVCVTCHAFLYPDIPNPSSFVFSEKTDDGDSGNDEPSVGEMLYYDRRLSRALQQRGIPNWAFRFQNSLDSETSPDDPIDLSYRPIFVMNYNRDGPNGSGPSGVRPNIGGPGGPNEGTNDRGLNRDTHDVGANRGHEEGPIGGFPNRGSSDEVTNRGLNDKSYDGPGGMGLNRHPNDSLNRGPNNEVPNRGPINENLNRGQNIVPNERNPNIPNELNIVPNELNIVPNELDIVPNELNIVPNELNIAPNEGDPNAGPSHDNGQGPAVPEDGLARPLPSSLARSLAALSTPRLPDNLAPGLVERLPSEVLLCMFSYLDDLSLCACAQVCVRWLRLVRARVSQTRWAAFASRRWPLFRPMLNIQDWHKKYQSLVESCFCRNCVVQMCTQSQPPFEENAWRRNRLRNEIKMLRNAPPEGCAATPLDPKCCHWQAMVTGPVGSPYEGGVFYLYIQVPFSYPMSPPVVRFLTRILHPNVSRHGDVGIDSVHHNWSLALTISKLLISIQSLLTDPYTAVCMEPDVGDMYVNERARFERIARRWTWRYAMHDMYSIN